jgi:Carbohydrate binding domain
MLDAFGSAMGTEALMRGVRGSVARIGLVAAFATVSLASVLVPAFADHSLQLDRIIETTPFAGSSVSMHDHEGSAYVPGDDTLWLADDNGKAIYEIEPATGMWLRTIPRSAFNAAPRFGGGPIAGPDRTNDFESLAYDAVNQHLYVFSGPCCSGAILPTAFRLTRDGTGMFQVESYQPLVSGADYTGAAWNPSDGTVYVGHAAQLRSYDYVWNVQGTAFSVPSLSGITGMAFTTTDLFVTTNGEKLRRVDWATKILVSGWTFDLLPFGVLDSRAVELIGDQFLVSDGADSRSAGDPLEYAVFVFDVTESPPSGNLVGNPDFEVDTSGWGTAGSGTGVTLGRSQPGHSGTWAAVLTNTSSGTRKCVLNDVPNWVTTTQPGTYTGTIWIRGGTAGKTIKITFKEMNGSTQVKAKTVTYTTTTSWQQLSVTLAPNSPGTTTLDFQVFLPKDHAPPGVCFRADDASITLS